MGRRRSGWSIAVGPWLVVGALLATSFSVGHAAAETPVPSISPLHSALGVPVLGSTPVRLSFVLEPANASELARWDAAVIDPQSPEFRHFLTEAQFVARFAPPESNLSAVAGFLRAHGATGLSPTADRLGLFATLPAGEVPSITGVTLEKLPRAGTWFVPAGALHWPAALVGRVAGVCGLDDLDRGSVARLPASSPARPVRSAGTPGQFVAVTGSPQQLLIGSDLTQGYRTATIFPGGGAAGNKTYGNGTAVATLLMSSYNATLGRDLPPFDPAVIDQYFNDTFNPAWPWPNVSGVPVPVDGVVPPSPGPFGSWQDDLLSEAENSLDLEMAGSMAPGARLVNFYFPASVFVGSAPPSYGSLADGFAACLAAALAHNYSGARLVAVTNSYGLPDLDDPLWDSELLHAAAIGVTIVASSGDQGDAPTNLTGRPQGPAPSWPATAAFASSGVLAVGGTSLTLSGAPTATVDSLTPPELNVTFDSSIGGIASETAWYDTSQGPGSYDGSEGGISTVYAEPPWQRSSAAQPAIVNSTLIQGAPQLGRALPDLALAASNIVAYTYANASGIYYELLSGTSIAAPLMAGMLAELSARSGHPYGFLDPLLYRAASFYAAHPNASSPFHDVTTGGNYLFRAAAGWDAVTGWGSVRADALVSALDNATVLGYNYTGPSPGLPPLPSPAPSHPRGPSAPPWVLWVLAMAAAAALGIALYADARAERRIVPPPPPGVFGHGMGDPRPPPERPTCARCGRERSPWLTVCPWCGLSG